MGKSLGWESTKDPSSSPGSLTLDNSLNLSASSDEKQAAGDDPVGLADEPLLVGGGT